MLRVIYTYNDDLYWKFFSFFQDHIESVFLVHINWEYVQDQLSWLLRVNCKELKEILHHQSELVCVQQVTVTFWTRNKLNSETHHPMPKQKSSVKYSAILPFSPYFFCPSIEPVDTQHIKLTKLSDHEILYTWPSWISFQLQSTFYTNLLTSDTYTN